MRALTWKLLRDLRLMIGQCITIALVVACGIAAFVAAFSNYDSLQWMRDSYYEAARFAHVFAELKRAPDSFLWRLEALPGVAEVEGTLAFDTILDLPGVPEPVVGRLVALPEHGLPHLNRLYLQRGRLPERDSVQEVLVSEAFATARGLQPGDRLAALLNGKRDTLSIVGIALSPEYILASRGPLLDFKSFGILWLARERVEAAFNMTGAFNRVALRLESRASEPAVMAAVESLLAPYGAFAVYGREEQHSYRMLAQEIDQQEVMGTALPIPFFGVAMFLLNLVLSRIIATQREQIAVLKALGYSHREIGWHYLQMVLIIVGVGIGLGVLLGAWLGQYMTTIYAGFFHFPHPHYRLRPAILVIGAGISLAAAVLGAVGAVRRVVRLAPAEAMRPPAPPRYRRMLVERLGMGHWLSPATRMVIRTLERRPWRVLLTTIGIAAAVAVVITGMFWQDAVEYLMTVQFYAADRGDISVAFTEPLSHAVTYDMARLPGVRKVEAERSVPVRLRAGHRSYRTAVLGLGREAELRRLLDREAQPVALPTEGLLLSSRLATRLRVQVGDRVRVETLEGKRLQREVQVTGLSDDLVGLSGYMEIGALNRLMGEGDLVSGVALTVEADRQQVLFRQLKALPKVATVTIKASALAMFRETSAQSVLFFTAIFTVFAWAIAVGVVYNAARIALAERAWELASLRVMGFTRAEVSTLLLSELAVPIVLAIPLGLPLGWLAAWGLVRATHTEMFQIPLIILPRTYAYAAVAILLAGVVSALIVRHRIDHLDLVAVLKTRE